MHHYSQLEALAAERIRNRLAEAEGSRLAHRSRADSQAARTTRVRKLWLPVFGLSPTRSTCHTPGIRLQSRAS
jgi:hypothetical protein